MFMWMITLVCLFEFNLAELMSCTEKTNKTEICFNDIGNHDTSKSVDTTLFLRQISALQMFAGIYGGFIGKSECGDFKFMGIACNPQSL